MTRKTRKTTKTPAKKTSSKAKATKPVSANATVRDGTKQAKVIAMLKSSAGATVEQMAKATGWQNHTVRGALAGALKKRLGLLITSEKDDARGRVYRISS